MKNRVNRKIDDTEKGSSLRIIFHVVLAISGWLLFGYFWIIVGTRGLSRGASFALVAMVIFAGLLAVSISWWVVHNLAISRKDRRKNLREVEEKPYGVDKIGKTVDMVDLPALKKSAVVDIMIEGDRKIYRTGSSRLDLEAEKEVD